ncbi:MAG: hypothetical protein JJLCMIEE_03404 [Acidimicrobiales bacterium]|nr:MAG: hypothetical protein EDR02_18165 [Actinomycetota bacterium]MBV6510267.1 hypothetical protein [Acidimicrobiales bacterium]RIK02771.1 MAG: hypothetical protein DCC48_17690 [Acidobacteriota bacterium]
MALSEKSRATLFQSLVPIAGEEATAEMLSHFPVRDVEEAVTKEHLDRRFAELRAELQAEMGELRGEMADLRGDMAGLRTEMYQLGTRLFISLTGAMVGVVGLAVALLRLTT